MIQIQDRKYLSPEGTLFLEGTFIIYKKFKLI